MAITEQCEILIADAHAAAGHVHVVVEEPLTVEQSAELRRMMELAEAEARGFQAGETNAHVENTLRGVVNSIFDGLKSAEDGKAG